METAARMEKLENELHVFPLSHKRLENLSQKRATSFPQFPQLLLLVLLPKKEKKECDISNELKHVTFLKSFDRITSAGLTTNECAGIVPRLEHGAFLVLSMRRRLVD